MDDTTRNLIQEISDRLTRLGGRLSVAESCTGGMIAGSCTAISGASDWFEAGLVTYTRRAKQQVLGLLDRDVRDGLVTEWTAITMAEHVAQLTGVDFALATTGVAGPTESEGYNPCAAWVAAHTPLGTVSRWIEQPDGGRETNRRLITQEALSLLLEELTKYEGTR